MQNLCFAIVLMGITPFALAKRIMIDTATGPRPVEKGAIHVPASRQEPATGTIMLPYLRFHGEGEGPPLFLLAGGPGNTYRDDLREEKSFGAWLDRFLAIGDVVLLEQRGAATTAQSQTFSIHATLDPARADSLGQLPAIMREAVRKARNATSEAQRAIRFNVAEMARDYHVLRRELNYERFNLMGGSFGSQLGLQIIRLEPAAVHRAIFYGIEGSADNIDRPELVAAHLDRVGKALTSDWQTRWLIGDFRSQLENVLRKIDETPLKGTVTDKDGNEHAVTVGALDLKLLLWQKEGLKGSRDHIAQVGRLLMALQFGYIQPVLEAKWRMCELLKSAEGWEWNLSSLLVEAASIPHGTTTPNDDEPDPAKFGPEVVDPLLYGLPKLLDPPPMDPIFRSPVAADTPVLLISGGLDGFTPPAYAREVAEHLPQAHLLYAPLGDHSGWEILESEPGLRDRALAFLSGEADVTSFRDQVELPPLPVKLVPDWLLLAAAAIPIVVTVIVIRCKAIKAD